MDVYNIEILVYLIVWWLFM